VLILGVETSSPQVSCALGGDDGVLAAAAVDRGQRHAELLAPMIRQLCEAAQVTLAEVGAVAVGVGPGLFTGLRVGLATARALAFALEVPMVGVSSLDVVAFPARLTDRTVVAVTDARRGELFWAFYRPTPDAPVRLTEPRVGRPAELAAEIAACPDRCLLVGDGVARYRTELCATGALCAGPVPARPSAADLVLLARAAAAAGALVPPAAIRPIYLRLPDAEANWLQRPGTTGPTTGSTTGAAS
jgi:tRNA threonylcarbamoyladenosine biosynthesis protein TsaB